ncbi:MAG: hypothetical protein AB1394_13545 [Bacteroidota bacterium]
MSSNWKFLKNKEWNTDNIDVAQMQQLARVFGGVCSAGIDSV